MERVFISSLYRGEMAAIRQAVRAAVDSLDMRPVMFETEPARDEASLAILPGAGGHRENASESCPCRGPA